MGKLSFSDMLVRIAKIFLAYFYVCPMIFILLFGTIFDFALNAIEYFDFVNISQRTRFLIEMYIQFPLTFIFPVMQSIRDGYRDSFYGRYSLKTYSIIAAASAVIYVIADPIIKMFKPRFNACPVGHIFAKLALPYTLSSIVYFGIMCGLIILFYWLGRRRALYENQEAVFKTEQSVAEEEKQKKIKDLPYTPQVEPRKTGTWRDSISRDE